MHRYFSFTVFALLLASTGARAQVAAPQLQAPAQAAAPAIAMPQGAGSAVQPAAPASPATEAAVPDINIQSPQAADYSANMKSNAFGAQLFTGSFARAGATRFNPDYLIAVGDRVQVRLWGGFAFDGVLPVDPQGNVFLPQIGPVRLAGVRNQDLQAVLDTAMRKVFRANVFGYASLAAAQPVRVFVGGYVARPGLYDGTSMDSVLHYLDQAGGIDPERGSFLDVQVKRGEQVRAHLNLYDFLLQGRIPQVQLADGDVIFIVARENTVSVSGLAANARRFEFRTPSISLSELSRMAKPAAGVTHVRVVRNTGTVRNTEYYSLADSDRIDVRNGDDVAFTADKKQGTITVRVEGEHQSAQEYVLPYGARMGALLGQIRYSERSEVNSIQLYRLSVRERQKTMLQTSLHSLESSVLTARSGTSDEARLRKDESELILQWVDRAKKVEPSGQVLIARAAGRDELLLENGDIITVPARDGLVLVSGEVLFPNAIAYDKALSLDDYIRRAGGYTQNAAGSRVVVAHRDGSYDDGASAPAMQPGDQILVLPKIDVKSRQIWKDLTQIIYQIAVSARVVLTL